MAYLICQFVADECSLVDGGAMATIGSGSSKVLRWRRRRDPDGGTVDAEVVMQWGGWMGLGRKGLQLEAAAGTDACLAEAKLGALGIKLTRQLT